MNVYARDTNDSAGGYAVQQKTKDEKSYVIGETKTAYIGDAIIERIQYKETIYPRKLVRPNVDIRYLNKYFCGDPRVCDVLIKSDRSYEIERTLSEGGIDYYLINPYRSDFSLIDITITNKSSIEVFINLDGTVSEYVRFAGAVMHKEWKPYPANAIYIFSDLTKIVKESYLSRNIVFLGVKDKKIKFRYTEKKYRDDSLVSSDPIEFAVENNNLIQVRNYKIQIIKITDNEITYKIIED
jgi:hypothetical protein